MVLLIVGKSGAGKTTHMKTLAKELRLSGVNVVDIDSDTVRNARGNKDYSDEGRKKHLLELAHIAKISEGVGAVVLIACMAPRREWRDMMRLEWKQSRLTYLPGGTLWPGTEYEVPHEDEYVVR